MTDYQASASYCYIEPYHQMWRETVNNYFIYAKCYKKSHSSGIQSPRWMNIERVPPPSGIAIMFEVNRLIFVQYMLQKRNGRADRRTDIPRDDYTHPNFLRGDKTYFLWYDITKTHIYYLHSSQFGFLNYFNTKNKLGQLHIQNVGATTCRYFTSRWKSTQNNI